MMQEEFVYWVTGGAALVALWVAWRFPDFYIAKYRWAQRTVYLYIFCAIAYAAGVANGLETVGVQILQVNYSVAEGFIGKRIWEIIRICGAILALSLFLEHLMRWRLPFRLPPKKVEKTT